MSDEVAAGFVTVLGALLLKLVLTGRFVDYVRPRMGPMLLGAAAVLLCAAAAAFVRLIAGSGRSGSAHASDGEDAYHVAGRAGLFLAIPLVLIAVVPPAPLGAFAAGLGANAGRAPPRSSFFPALPRADGGAVTLSMSDFVSRAIYDPDASLRGVTVRLIGFAAPDRAHGTDGAFDLVRFAMTCCAADAIALRVRILGARGPTPAANAWIEVLGTWRLAPARPPGAFDPTVLPELDVTSMRSIPQPADPYDASV